MSWKSVAGTSNIIAMHVVMLVVFVGSAATLPQPTDYLEEFATTRESASPSLLTSSSSSSSLLSTAAAQSQAAANVDAISINDGVEFSAIPSESNFAVTPCSLNDVSRNECIKDLLQQIIPKLTVGLPQYNINAVDPYFYKRGIFRYSNDGIQGGLLIKNMNIRGISKIRITNFASNFTDNGFIVKLNAEVPQIQADGHFKADVKFGGLRLVPKGPFNITIDNIKATVLTDGTLEDTETGRRLKLNRLNANIAIGNAHIIANGIFSDRNLNAMMLNLVNENLLEITRVGIPATRDQWAPILVTHVNEFFANVPIEKFLVH